MRTEDPYLLKKSDFVPFCKLCNDKHQIDECEKYKKIEIKEKWDTATKLGVCFKCLKKSHLAKKCKNNTKCGIESCQLEHHELLHRNKNNLEKSIADKTNLESDSNLTNKFSLHTQTLIKKKSTRTVTVLVKQR